jgi:hypothetical protein
MEKVYDIIITIIHGTERERERERERDRERNGLVVIA